jgi:hypothetical protein
MTALNLNLNQERVGIFVLFPQNNIITMQFSTHDNEIIFQTFVDIIVGLYKGRFHGGEQADERLAAEAVQGTSLALQSVDDIHGGDRLPLGVFGVSDSVTNDVLQENFEDTTRLLINQSRDAFDATTTGKATNSGLRDALDVITQHLAMTLGSSLPQAFASLSTTGHDSNTRRGRENDRADQLRQSD